MATNALTASKTPGIIVAEIKMMSTSFKGVHLLVEGDDDSKFWKPRVAAGFVTIVNCEGKPNLLGASALIQRLGISSVAGVYDPDFERLFGVTHHLWATPRTCRFSAGLEMLMDFPVRMRYAKMVDTGSER